MFTPASYGLRAAALIIDLIIMSVFRGALMFIFLAVGWLKENNHEQEKLIQEMAINKADPEIILGATMRLALDNGLIHFSAFFFIFTVIVFVIFIVKKGGTPGKLALGLRIHDAKTKKNPSWPKAILRETIAKLISSLVLVGYLVPLFRQDKRALHDLIARTEVIKK